MAEVYFFRRVMFASGTKVHPREAGQHREWLELFTLKNELRRLNQTTSQHKRGMA